MRIARLRSTISISLAIDATIRLPTSSRMRKASSSLSSNVSVQIDSGGSRLGKLDRYSDAASQAPHPTARDIVHVQHPAGFLRTGAPLAKGKDGAARNDKEAAELGEPGDDIVGKSVSEAASRAVANRPVEKGHHRDRSPALCNRAVPDSVGRQRKSARGRCCSPGARDTCRSTPGGAPCFAKRRPVQTLGFEQLGRRSEVLFALANSAAPGKCA